MNHSKFLAVALALVMIVPVAAISISEDSDAAESSYTYKLETFANNPFEYRVQFLGGYQFYPGNLPEGVSVEAKIYNGLKWIYVSGKIDTPGTYSFTVDLGINDDHDYVGTFTVEIEVKNAPHGLNYNNLGIDAKLDDFLNPFRYGGSEQTLTITNDESIRLKPGKYNFKFKGWLWGEDHNADLTGETNGLIKDGDGNWVGMLNPGRYEFTVIIDKDNLSFKFYIQVNEKKVDLNYHNEGSIVDAEYTWGIPFNLQNTTNGDYTLEGWYTGDGRYIGAPGDNFIIYENTDLYAKWISNVIVMDSDGTVLNVMEVEKDTTCTLPTVTKEGYEFSHWSTEPDGDAVISDGTSPYKPTGDIVLYPVFADDLRFPVPEFSLVTEG